MKSVFFSLCVAGLSFGATAQITFNAVNYPDASYPGMQPIGAIATVDMNGDYLDDMILVNQTELRILYQQSGGNFNTVNYTTTPITYGPEWSIAVGDIDKNGFNDLLYGGGSGVSFYKANATGTAYTEMAQNQFVFSQRSNFVDIDNDGKLDAFVCHDVEPNVYYINDGNGNFTYHQGGIGDHPEGGNYGSVWVDYDNDGDTDLFIAKCRGGQSTAKINELHRNDGNGNFTNVSTAANMADPMQTWSSAWNDYDNDGDMDALIGISSPEDGSHKLMKNNGNGTFSDVTANSGWHNFTDLSIEYVSYDFDNDGYADVLADGKFIFFNQDGNMTFSKVEYSHQGATSVADLNNDGFLDLRSSTQVYINSGNNNNWTKIQLKGIASNINGIGARVEIYGAWGKQIRDVRSGEGFAAMSTLNVHFGIGTATAIDSIIVKWPSGQVDKVEDPAINSAVTIVEGNLPLSLLEVDGKKISIYPNPASEYLMIQNADMLQVSEVAIFSLSGEKILSQSNSFSKLEIGSLPEGAYVLVMRTLDGSSYSESFVKKRN